MNMNITKEKEGYKKTEILYINEGKKIYKMPCSIAVNCINIRKRYSII